MKRFEAVVMVMVAGACSAEETTKPTEAATVASPITPPPAVLPDAAPPRLPDWFELRVERVQVAPGRQWDGPMEKRTDRDRCREVAEVARFAGAQGVGVVCDLFKNEQQQSDPSAPDLQLLLEAASVRYLSYVAADRPSHMFDYAFAVPSSALTDDGFVLAVVDNDNDSDRGEEIGSLRLTKEALIAALTVGTMQTPTLDGLRLFEYSVRAHDGKLTRAEETFPSKEGGRNVAAVEVAAGDFIRIEAAGSWQVGRWNDRVLDPAGFADKPFGATNLKAFPNARHGGAVALVGRGGQVLRMEVSRCLRAVVPFAGVVWVGINDSNPGDNRGTATFRVLRRGSAANEWKRPGSTYACNDR